MLGSVSIEWVERFRTTVEAGSPHLLDGEASKFAFSLDSIRLRGGGAIKVQTAGVTAIVGANNAGKSTVLREVAEHLGRQPGNPFNPPLSVEGLDLTKSGEPRDLAAWLGETANFVIQNDQAFFQRPIAGQAAIWQVQQAWGDAATNLGGLAPFLMFYGNAQARFGIGGSAEMRDSPVDPATHPVHRLQDSRALLERVSEISRLIFGHHLTLDTLARTIRLRVGKIDAEAPRIDDVTEEYRNAMAKLRPLDEQGDGMRSLFGQLLPLTAGEYPLIIIDEPEAFLHPPQAHALGAQLGALSVERGVQILVATHDRNFLTGLLDSGVQVSVVRLQQTDGVTAANQLQAGDLQTLWNDPVLKYTNVLDGLFHRLVVLAEAEGDCAYLAAALDCAGRPASEFPKNEILFVPTGGKDGMPKVASALAAVSVPVIAAPDLDMMNDLDKLKEIVKELAPDKWTPVLEKLWNEATVDLRVKREPAKVGHVLDAISGALSDSRDEFYSDEFKSVVHAQMRTSGSPWGAVKEYGIAAFKGQAYTAVVALLDEMDKIGLVLVRDGELERLAPEVAVRKGPQWLAAALSLDAQCNEKTQAHVDRIVTAAATLLGSST